MSELPPPDTLKFFQTVLEKAVRTTQQIETQSNIIIGLSSALFLYSTREFQSNPTVFIALMAIGSALAAIVALMAIHPPRFMRKRGQSESLMYNRKATSYKNPQEYTEALKRVSNTQEGIFDEFGMEIYNLFKYYHQPKRKLHNLARNILLVTILSSLLAYVAQNLGYL